MGLREEKGNDGGLESGRTVRSDSEDYEGSEEGRNVRRCHGGGPARRRARSRLYGFCVFFPPLVELGASTCVG